MRLAYTLTANDLVEAQRKHGGWWSKLEPVWGLCLFAAGLASLAMNRNGLPAAGFTTMLGLFFLFGRTWLIRRAFRRDNRLQQPFETVVSDSGIDVSSASSSSQHTWSAFTRFVETKNLFLVYQAENLVNIIPKRAFLAGEEESFRALLSSRLGAASAAYARKISPRTLIFCFVVIMAAMLLWTVIRNG
jgi:hypothetical protein